MLQTVLEPLVGEYNSAIALSPALELTQVVHQQPSGDDHLVTTVTNRGAAFRPRFIQIYRALIPTAGPATNYRSLVHGFHSFSGSGSFDFSQRVPRVRLKWLEPCAHNMAVPPSPRKGQFVSAMVGALAREDGSSLITIGTLDPTTFSVQVITTWTPRGIELSVQVQMEDTEIAPGATVILPTLFRSSAPISAALARWTTALADEQQVAPTRVVPDGYCSWYRHYTKISQAQILRDLDATHAALADEFELFHMDDGYQSAVGDWLSPAPTFPDGTAQIASAVRAKGMKAGIWVAPFFALAHSQVAREHPDWVLRTERGRPVPGMLNILWDPQHPVRVLDITRPDVLEHLHRVFSDLRSQGFTFFKLDFLYSGTLPGERWNRSITSLSATRAALAVIRDAVGEESFLLGCGCPVEAAIGTVDATRSSADVTPAWRERAVTRGIGGDFETLGTGVARRNVLARSFQHRVWFENDPDCLFAYEPNNRLTAAESRTLMQTNSLAGGPLMFATSADELDASQIAMLKSARAINDEVQELATSWWCPDLMTRNEPELFAALGIDRGWVMLTNLDATAADRRLDLFAVFGWDEVTIEVLAAAHPQRVHLSGTTLLCAGLERHDSVLVRVLPAAG
jgi:alpha-galactosidase